MIPVDWMSRFVPELRNLAPVGREEITNFVFLWAKFEASALHTRASVGGIIRASKRWEKGGALDANSFRRELAYFRSRYVERGEFTRRFRGLRLEISGERGSVLVKEVLAGNEAAPHKAAAAALIVVYRLRNNLFHGAKSFQELPHQQGVFRHANNVLMRAIELQEHSRTRGAPPVPRRP